MCGETAAKVAMKNHLINAHNTGAEPCRLILAEGAYVKNYWLLFSIATDTSMATIDKFLRQIWCECCDHLSQFDSNQSTKIALLATKQKISYKYDMGSTTEIVLTVLDALSRPPQKEKICLLARNMPHAKTCNTCGAPATFINAWEDAFACAACAKKAKNAGVMLSFVNSPRAGVCGYEGEFDRWTFNPHKPFPQIPSALKR
jgi:hypothetical protein